MKKRILCLLTAITLMTSLLTIVPASATTNYKELDLSLTQTTFSGLNESGSIKANLIAEETVTMPVLTKSQWGDAVLLNSDGTYQTTEGTAALQPQRKAITEGTVTYTTDDTAVITLNSDGTFTTVGYGVANVNVVYDNNTPDNSSDDVSSNVIITVSDNSKLKIYFGTYTGAAGLTTLVEKDGITASGHSGRSLMYSNFNLNWDPVGTVNDPLVQMSVSNAGNGDATAPVAAGETAVFSGWFYDTMQKANQNFMSFGYAGTTDAATVQNDGNSSMMIAAHDATTYKLLGGVYSSSWAHLNYNYEKLTGTAAQANNATAGVSNAGVRSVGWHQFVVTAETSIVNPGTGYILVKAYLDGELITAQDIYVGNVPVEKRRFNIFGSPRLAATGGDVYYKDLSVKTFKRTGVIAESIPSDNAVDVPLRQLIKVKLTSASSSVPAVSVTANGDSVSASAALDATGTIVTINAGKLTAGAQYVVTVAGESFTFTAGNDSEMSAMLDSMTDYKIKDTRYVDFADTDKTAEEYGVGYVHNHPGTESKVNANYLTMTEKARSATTYDNNNGIIIRNISPRNGDADRVVVSYKFKPQTLATDPNSASGGIGRPYMAVDNAANTYNALTTEMISGGQWNSANVMTASTGVNAKGYFVVADYMLMGNATNTGKAVTEAGTDVLNGYLYMPATAAPETVSNYVLTADSDGWYRLTYVIDVDKNGVNAPTWTTIFGNDFDDANSIFKLKQTPLNTTAYTSVDAIFIPTTKKAAVTADIVTDIKDIEVYQLEKKRQVSIDEQPVVTVAGTEDEVLAGNLAGKTVDVSINAQGNGEAYTIIVAAMTESNRLLSVKTDDGTLGSSADIGIENFVIPVAENNENVKLHVFVWESFENPVPLFERIEYTKSE